MPEASIIIPLYNRAEYLEKAVDSILRQTYQDFEIVIVDDGSVEDVKTAIDLCVVKAPEKIRYVYQKNQGAGAARNTGVKEATGKYVAFLDADDEWLNTYLEKTIGALKNHQCDWVSTASFRIQLDENEKETERTKIQMEPVAGEDELFAQLLKEINVIGGPSQVVVSKECFVDAGLYRVDLPVREDWEMWLRLAKRKYRYRKILEPLYLYKIRQNSITKTGIVMGRTSAYKIFCEYSKDAFNVDNDNRELYAEKLWNIARHIFYDGMRSPLLFIKCIWKSQLYKPSFSRVFKSAKHIKTSAKATG